MAALASGFSVDFPRHSCEQLFAIATDVERYPAFIPWCIAARVVSVEGAVRQVENHFGAGPADLGFRTQAVDDPPHRLSISSSDGPFRRFELVWTFAPLPTRGCRVRADYVVDFRSPVLQGLARLTAREVERRMVRRFRDRALAVYG